MMSIVILGIGVYAILVYTSTPNVSATPEKILLHDTFVDENSHYVRVNDMKPNSFGFFMYPSSYNFSSPANAYQRFLLIRLPEWQTGGNDTITSFRAYSAIDPSSHCVIRYWPQKERQRIEDPCSGDMYRVIDGYLYMRGGDPTLLQKNIGLPKLDLSVDGDGYIYANTPTWTDDKNGAIGIGRKLSQDEINQNTIFLEKREAEIQAHKFSYPQWLVTGQHVVSVNGDQYMETIIYQGGDPSHNFILIAELCDCGNNPYFITSKAGRYSEVWHLGNDTMLVTPKSVGINGNSNYIFCFFKDGYIVTFVTDQSFDDGTKTVLDNFFNGTKLSEMTQVERK